MISRTLPGPITNLATFGTLWGVKSLVAVENADASLDGKKQAFRTSTPIPPFLLQKSTNSGFLTSSFTWLAAASIAMSFKNRSVSGVSVYKSFKLEVKEAQFHAADTALSYFSLASFFSSATLM